LPIRTFRQFLCAQKQHRFYEFGLHDSLPIFIIVPKPAPASPV
jgi:hypothetical protein